MAQTRMFRDRMVSMEQTLEGGEKHLALLTEICREAFPDLELREHALDHERDLFVMELHGPEGRRVKVCWTRMVLFDAERIPTLTAEPAAELRGKIVEYLRARRDRPEIVVTFRHLEEGWVETPEPRREGRRRRRGGRGGKGHERGRPEGRPQGPGPGGPARKGPPVPPGPRPAAAPGQPQPQAARDASPETSGAAAPGGKRRRRFRRRRRGRGQRGGSAGPGDPGSDRP